MRRTNIYLDDDQRAKLKVLSAARGMPMASLVREAVNAWLASQGVRRIPEDEWHQRFDRLMSERRRIYDEHEWDPEEIERDVMEAVREVRAEHAARRR
jgi:ribbon-helix-helix CopG family protein